MFLQHIGAYGRHNTIIKSIQDVTVSIGATAKYATATLATSVDPNNSVIIYRGQRATGVKNERYYHMGRLQLLDGSTAEAETWSDTSSDDTGEVQRDFYGTVVEFFPWAITRRVQGIHTLSGSETGLYDNLGFTLGSNRYAVFHQGQMVEGATQSTGVSFGRLFWANGVGLGGFRNNTQSNWQLKTAYTLIEFAQGIIVSWDGFGHSLSGSQSAQDYVITASGNFARNRTWMVWGGSMSGGGFQRDLGTIYMNGDKAYRIQRETAPGTSWTAQVTFLEFDDRWVKDGQHGVTRILSGASTQDSAINSVDTAKTVVNYYGQASDNPFGNIDYTLIENKLQSATAERCQRNVSPGQYVESGFSAITFR